MHVIMIDGRETALSVFQIRDKQRLLIEEESYLEESYRWLNVYPNCFAGHFDDKGFMLS